MIALSLYFVAENYHKLISTTKYGLFQPNYISTLLHTNVILILVIDLN